MRPFASRSLALLVVAVLACAPVAWGKPHKRAAAEPSELVVHFAEFNGTLQEGSSNGVYASIENSAAPTASAFVVRFEVDGALLGDAAMPAGFAGFGSPNAPQRWTATAGTHTLRVVVDATDAVAEPDESDNVFTHAFTVQGDGGPGASELRVQYGAWNGTAWEGIPIDAYASIENAGAATTRSFAVAFQVDDVSLGYGSLPAGFTGIGTTNSPETWTPTVGTHVLRVEVDPFDEVGELDETDNVFTWTFDVEETGSLAELSFLGVKFNQPVEEGRWSDVTAIVENHGATTTHDVEVAFWVDAASLGQATIPAGFRGQVEVTSPQGWVATEGGHRLRVVVDPEWMEPEGEENDNELWYDFQVADSLDTDLSVTEAQFNGTFSGGSTGRFGVYVENWGDPTPVDTLVHFQVDSTWLGNAVLPAGFQGRALVEAPELWTATPGLHAFYGTADAGGRLSEPDEGDNTYTWYFRVDGMPPPQRETIFLWGTPLPSAPDATVETTTLYLEDYQSVLYDLRCLGSTVQVYFDGQLVAACAQGVRVETYVEVIGEGMHTFTIVYAGLGFGSLEVSGIPMIY